MINIIVPFSRPDRLPAVLDNFKRQHHADKRLIVVENGRALGACKHAGVAPDVLLTSDAHQAHAKNEGLAWIRKNGGGYFATMDDDDYYGPDYLTEVEAHRKNGTVVGKLDQFVSMGDKLLLLQGQVEEDGQPIQSLNGPTICAQAEDSVDFPADKPWGEDGDWLEKMRRKGATFWATSPYHYCYRRHPHSTWPVKDESYLRIMLFGSGGKLRVWEVGRWPSKVAVVNREAKPDLYEYQFDTFLSPSDFPKYESHHR